MAKTKTTEAAKPAAKAAPKPKIGAGSLAAMGRLGLKELRNAFNPSKESVADTELGMYGSATQGEIATARGGAGGGAEQETMTLGQLKNGLEGKSPSQDGPEQDQGMER